MSLHHLLRGSHGRPCTLGSDALRRAFMLENLRWLCPGATDAAHGSINGPRGTCQSAQWPGVGAKGPARRPRPGRVSSSRRLIRSGNPAPIRALT